MTANLFEQIVRLRRGASRRARRLLYGLRCKRFGRGVEIADHVLIFCPEFIEIGDGVTINDRVILQSCEGGELTIGDQAVLSYGAYIITGGRSLADGKVEQTHSRAPVSIGPGAWIGAGAIVLPGVTIAASAVVGAGSVVTKDVPEGCKVVGSPARPI